ncbi:DUF6875 domain-containing protein [Nocardioides jensenii]|uniref:DUF6875 domain-containing protein n=1 Tax=Nocardioides jensenii TaxID=1843 RepID=UPI00083081D6|nr:hypothetical protein [Nocardioides jensenii]
MTAQVPLLETLEQEGGDRRGITVSAADVPLSRIISDLSEVERWLSDYVAQPHSEIGRTGAVCPFVAPSIDAGSMMIRLDYAVTGHQVDELVASLMAHVNEFASAAVPERKRLLRSVLVVLPCLTGSGRANLDATYSVLKASAVRRGLMVGQFHEDCDQRAIRNSGFRVSRSPVPLLAVRFMALHDILFLGEDRRMFEEYRRRFGRHHDTGRVRDASLRTAYAAAMHAHPDSVRPS